MSKKKQSLQRTSQLIIDILSFETSDTVLEQQLANEHVDWDHIVTIASEHLVLPAVYCRLKEKSCLKSLPEDLVVYLEELTKLNRDRNKTLLNEAKQISGLFQANSIHHTFIKGIALLAGNYFEDIGERMVGDIDILVATKDLDRAFNLLVNEGYSNFVPFNYEVKNFRHRPRQISKKSLGAVELHDQLLKHNYNHLIDKNHFLLSKEYVNGINIPNSENLIKNTIFAHQINDRCHYYHTLKLKSLYDVLVLGLPKKENLIKELCNQKYSLGYLNLASVLYHTNAPLKKTILNRFNKYYYLLILNFPFFRKYSLYLKSIYIITIERVELLFNNKSYRTHVLKNKLK